jgi:hypothetical protein
MSLIVVLLQKCYALLVIWSEISQLDSFGVESGPRMTLEKSIKPEFIFNRSHIAQSQPHLRLGVRR